MQNSILNVLVTIAAGAVFGILLWASFRLLNRVPPRYTIDDGKKQEIDYRAVLFTLRMALTFGIGAVLVGILLVVALFALQLS